MKTAHRMQRRTTDPSLGRLSQCFLLQNVIRDVRRTEEHSSRATYGMFVNREPPVRRIASQGGLFWTRVSRAMQLGSSRPRRKNHGPLLTYYTYLQSSGSSAAFNVLFTAEGCLHRVQWTRTEQGTRRSPFTLPFPPFYKSTRIVDICQCGRYRHANIEEGQ